ncbi:MAG: hypothetical protein PHQ87_11430 [Hydrogenophaga sp.]|uniref:hypothetical protein n=1 Tax=Hydrogenophaga sp. TaxID=1904254 RepID=UPI00260F44B8|nr:hypothetical protein [Hydrogenophaga sp.]MDD3786148.1 hypothetical protein [Hydrogenophaga sp.]
MLRSIYQAFTDYALVIVGIFSAYSERTSHWPALCSLGLLLATAIGIDLLLPTWAALTIFAAVGVPLVWFLASVISAYVIHHRR